MEQQTDVSADADASNSSEPPVFVSTKPRSREISLDWPLRYDGKLYDRITVRRMTTAEVGQFIAAASAEDYKEARLPMFDCPPEVIDALDPDDAERVNEAVRDFLPRALRPAEGPRPDTGGTMRQSSVTS
jgi:hypothetical protein